MSDAVKLSAQERVKKKFPLAFVDDDGQWVYIRNKKEISGPCPTCGQMATIQRTDFQGTLGSGNCAQSAWQDAADKLGVIAWLV